MCKNNTTQRTVRLAWRGGRSSLHQNSFWFSFFALCFILSQMLIFHPKYLGKNCCHVYGNGIHSFSGVFSFRAKCSFTNKSSNWIGMGVCKSMCVCVRASAEVFRRVSCAPCVVRKKRHAAQLSWLHSVTLGTHIHGRCVQQQRLQRKEHAVFKFSSLALNRDKICLR